MRDRRATHELVWECAHRLLDAAVPMPWPEGAVRFWRLYEELLRLVETLEATDGRDFGR